jgi:purine nucleoside phosphorylase
LGVTTFIVTNAAGVARLPARSLITDHLNLTGRNPHRSGGGGEPRFPDMSAAYDPVPRWRMKWREADRLAEGSTRLLGPSCETPAEIRMCEDAARMRWA